MAGDAGYGRYFAFMSLFTASMLGLVIANNFFQLFVFWELVGLCSYLLIGFWYYKPEAAAAAKKAFLITRIGDFGFLIAILILFNLTGTFDFHEIEQAAKAGLIGMGLLTLVMVLVFSGAVGKSAQFPLHVWLPDAMEGPTPVSALIHAATMVAAGVYLVARLFDLFQSRARCDACGRVPRRVHRSFRREPRPRRPRYQTGVGVLNCQPARLHDARAGRGRVLGRHVASDDARRVQSAALSRRRQRNSRRRRAGPVQARTTCRQDEDNRGHLFDRRTSIGRHPAAERLLEQGRDPDRNAPFRPLAALPRRVADHGVDRVLYFARLASHFLG